MSQPIPAVIAEHIRAVNAFDTDAIVRTFAPDALVNDNRREIIGTEAIRRWVAKELVGDKVTMQIREVIEHHGGTIVRACYDGLFDRTKLPAELILSNYFTVRDGRITTLIIVFNQPSPY
jgi:ketosteroid isomerase-like protein